MRLSDEKIRQALAAEFVVGTLTARARRRFRSLLRYDAKLRAMVDAWERRLDPLAAGLAEREPPARVWRAIAARMRAERSRAPHAATQSARFWRALALAMMLLLAVGTAYVGMALREERRPDMMAVLADEKQEAAVLVSWPEQAGEKKYVRVRTVLPKMVAAEGSWELWLIPSERMDRPISAGVIALTQQQTLELSAEAAAALADAWGFAVSVEPKGGSPTGSPTGPVIFRGPCIRLINT